ncbi:MAG: hypothetical protein PVF53_21975 [Desulfobacterales bacterium]|jgi:diaminopimelate decarboxylase
MSIKNEPPRLWWEREDLGYRKGRLFLLAQNISLPAIQEGDYLGFLNVGGYGSAASSNHRMRGTFSEYLVVD